MSPPWGTATFPKPGRPDGDKDAGTARRKWTRVHIEPTPKRRQELDVRY